MRIVRPLFLLTVVVGASLFVATTTFQLPYEHIWRITEKKFSENHSNLRVGVISMERVRKQSKIYVALKNTIEEKYKKFHNEILNEETMLRQELVKLRQASPMHGKPITSEFLKTKEEFDKRVASLERSVQIKKELLDQKFAEASQEVDMAFLESIRMVSRERHLSLVLNATAALYSADRYDITAFVIDHLDKSKPTLDTDLSLGN